MYSQYPRFDKTRPKISKKSFMKIHFFQNLNKKLILVEKKIYFLKINLLFFKKISKKAFN